MAGWVSAPDFVSPAMPHDALVETVRRSCDMERDRATYWVDRILRIGRPITVCLLQPGDVVVTLTPAVDEAGQTVAVLR